MGGNRPDGGRRLGCGSGRDVEGARPPPWARREIVRVVGQARCRKIGVRLEWESRRAARENAAAVDGMCVALGEPAHAIATADARRDKRARACGSGRWMRIAVGLARERAARPLANTQRDERSAVGEGTRRAVRADSRGAASSGTCHNRRERLPVATASGATASSMAMRRSGSRRELAL